MTLPYRIGPADQARRSGTCSDRVKGHLAHQMESAMNIEAFGCERHALDYRDPSKRLRYGLLTSLKYIEIWGTLLGGTVGPEVYALEFGTFTADCRGNLLICDCGTECNLGTAVASSRDWDEPSINDKAP
jgi:hypothetical protein